MKLCLWHLQAFVEQFLLYSYDFSSVSSDGADDCIIDVGISKLLSSQCHPQLTELNELGLELTELFHTAHSSVNMLS